MVFGSGKAKGGALEMCKALLEEFRVESSMYQMGRTRIFFRAGVLGHLEDTWARIQRSVLGNMHEVLLSASTSMCMAWTVCIAAGEGFSTA